MMVVPQTVFSLVDPVASGCPQKPARVSLSSERGLFYSNVPDLVSFPGASASPLGNKYGERCSAPLCSRFVGEAA